MDSFGRFDEVWVIARHEKALEELRDQVPYPIRPLALDLTDRRSFQTYADALAEEPVEVGLLVNASGFGKFRAVVDTPLETNLNMVDLNCQAVMALCQLTVPYMPRGGQIINIASVAAFQPIPYINVYGATKAFVLSFSRALNRELRSQGVRVMALCPFWTRTAFFDRATGDGGESVVKKYVAMYEPEQLVQRGMAGRQAGQGCVPVRLCGQIPGGADEAPAPQPGDGRLDAGSKSCNKALQSPGKRHIIINYLYYKERSRWIA